MPELEGDEEAAASVAPSAATTAKLEARLAKAQLKLAKLQLRMNEDGIDDDFTIKRKEAEKIVFDRLPRVEKWNTWNNKRHRTITSASGRPDECNLYLLDNEDKTYEELGKIPKKWKSLDEKEASGYLNIVDGELAVDINHEIIELRKKRQMITGAQIFFRIRDWYRTHEKLQPLWSMNDLQCIKFGAYGDSNLREFRDAWRSCIQGFKRKPTEEQWEQIEELFMREIESSKIMEHAVNEYKWAKKGEERKTYNWVFDQIEFILNEKHMRKNRDDMAKAIKGGKFPIPGAPAVKDERVKKKKEKKEKKEKKKKKKKDDDGEE